MAHKGCALFTNPSEKAPCARLLPGWASTAVLRIMMIWCSSYLSGVLDSCACFSPSAPCSSSSLTCLTRNRGLAHNRIFGLSTRSDDLAMHKFTQSRGSGCTYGLCRHYLLKKNCRFSRAPACTISLTRHSAHTVRKKHSEQRSKVYNCWKSALWQC